MVAIARPEQKPEATGDKQADTDKLEPPELADLGGVGKAITAGFTVLTAAGTFLGVESGTFSAILAAEPRRAMVLFLVVGLAVTCALIAPVLTNAVPPAPPAKSSVAAATGSFSLAARVAMVLTLIWAILSVRPAGTSPPVRPAPAQGVPLAALMGMLAVVSGAVLWTFSGLEGFEDLTPEEKLWPWLWTLLTVGAVVILLVRLGGRWRVDSSAAVLVASLVLFGCGLYGTVRLVLASRAAGGPVALAVDVTGSGDERAVKLTVAARDLGENRVALLVDKLREPEGTCSGNLPGCRSRIVLVPDRSGTLTATVSVPLTGSDFTELVVSVAAIPCFREPATDTPPPIACSQDGKPEERARIDLTPPAPAPQGS